MTFTCAFVSAAIAAAGLATPQARFISPDRGVAVAVEIDTSALGDFGDVLHRRLDYEVGEELNRRTIARDGTAPRRIRIVVEASNARKSGYAYTVETAGGKAAAPARDKCEPCTDELAVQAIMGALPTHLDALLTDEAAATASSTEVEGAAGLTPAPTEASRDGAAHQREGAGPARPKLAKAGYALIGTGAALSVTGVVLLAIRPDPVPAPDNSAQSRARNLRDPGIVALSVGAGVLVAGIVMAIVGSKKPKRNVAVAPAGGRDGLGLAVSGRF